MGDADGEKCCGRLPSYREILNRIPDCNAQLVTRYTINPAAGTRDRLKLDDWHKISGAGFGYHVVAGDPTVRIATSKPGADRSLPDVEGHPLVAGRFSWTPFRELWVYFPAAAATTITIDVLMVPGQVAEFFAVALRDASGNFAAIRDANAESDFISTLLGLVTNSRMAVLNQNGGEWARVTGSHPASLEGVSTTVPAGIPIVANAVNFGVDTTAAAVLRMVEARNMDADADTDPAHTRLLVSAALSVLNGNNLAQGRRVVGYPTVSLEGGTQFLASGLPALPANAFLIGRDSGAAVQRILEARTGASGNFGSALYSLLVQARLGAYDGTDYGRLLQRREINGAEGGGLGTLNLRKAGYWGGRANARYCLTGAEDLVFVSTSGFTATDPSILIVNTTGGDLIIRRVWFVLHEAGGAVLKGCFVVDRDNRYSSGGTSFIPTGGFKETNLGGQTGFTPTQARYYDGATAIVATAADNDEYKSGTKAFKGATGDIGAEVSWEPEDDIIIPDSGSFLGYVFGSGSVDFTAAIEVERRDVQ